MGLASADSLWTALWITARGYTHARPARAEPHRLSTASSTKLSSDSPSQTLNDAARHATNTVRHHVRRLLRQLIHRTCHALHRPSQRPLNIMTKHDIFRPWCLIDRNRPQDLDPDLRPPARMWTKRAAHRLITATHRLRVVTVTFKIIGFKKRACVETTRPLIGETSMRALHAGFRRHRALAHRPSGSCARPAAICPSTARPAQTAGSFLDLCYNPRLAAEVTLQPIRRYGFDAAILFSDILVVPDALGQGVRFVEGEGPRLDAITSAADLTTPRTRPRPPPKFTIVAETVQRLRQDLPTETALIGFCGAPWTVATYMVAGEGTKDQAPARLLAYRDPAGFQRLIDILVDASIEYLSLQVKAGADAAADLRHLGRQPRRRTNSSAGSSPRPSASSPPSTRVTPACRSSAFRAAPAARVSPSSRQPASTASAATPP